MNYKQFVNKYGEGYVIEDEENGTLGLERCPECKKENYALNVFSGICTWCGFNANGDDK